MEELSLSVVFPTARSQAKVRYLLERALVHLALHRSGTVSWNTRAGTVYTAWEISSVPCACKQLGTTKHKRLQPVQRTSGETEAISTRDGSLSPAQTDSRFQRSWQSRCILVYFHRQLWLSNRSELSTGGSKSPKEVKKHSPGRKRGLERCWTCSYDLRQKKSCSCIPCTP